MHQIKHFMTDAPHAIGHDQTLKLAHERMQQWRIRHLPVLDGGVLVGVLSERDFALLQAISPTSVEEATVEEAMSTEPYVVEPSASLESVTAHMAEHQSACAVVMDHHKVLGVFTPLDALGLLSSLLRETQDDTQVTRVLKAKSRASHAPKAKS
jgi:acetoin utilization protein AcuB